MAAGPRARRRRSCTPAVAATAADDDGEEHHLNPFLSAAPSPSWRVQFRFLAERGPLVLLDDEEETIGMEDIYEKIAGGNYGCSWDAFQAYKHLKLLGYIIGRYGVPWTMKNTSTCDITDSPTSMVGTYQSFNRTNGACNDITKLLKEMHIDGIYPSFEVYLPNSKFKGHPQESLVPPMPVKG